jgi:predicted  nucleic acid-binding Zn-ribbon protein
MERKAAWLFAGILALAVPAFAQSGATDTLSALLVEVRQLRIAMERAATTTPQIQLLGTRLSIQNDRLARAERDHGAVRQELEAVSASLGQLVARIDDLDNASARETNPERQRGFAQEQSDAKTQVAELTAREQRLRVRESELAATVGSEQLQWTELNRRLDAIEQGIDARAPR